MTSPTVVDVPLRGRLDTVIHRACNLDISLAKRKAAARKVHSLVSQGPMRMCIESVHCTLVALCRHVSPEEAARVVPNLMIRRLPFEKFGFDEYGDELREVWIKNEPALAVAVARHADLRGHMFYNAGLLLHAELSPVGAALLADLSLREIEDAIGCAQVHTSHLATIRDASDEDARYVFVRHLTLTHRSRPRPYIPEALHTKYAQRIMASPASVLAMLQMAGDGGNLTTALVGLLHPDEKMPRVQRQAWTAEERTQLAISIASAMLDVPTGIYNLHFERLPCVLGVEMTLDLGLVMMGVIVSSRWGLSEPSMQWVVEQTLALVVGNPFEHPDLRRLLAQIPLVIRERMDAMFSKRFRMHVPRTWSSRVAVGLANAFSMCADRMWLHFQSPWRRRICTAARQLARCWWVPFSAIATCYDDARLRNAVRLWRRHRDGDDVLFANLRLAICVCQTRSQHMREAPPAMASLAYLCLEYRAVTRCGGGVVLRGVVLPLLRRCLRAHYASMRDGCADSFEDIVLPLLRTDVEWL